jgi:hypothetical protein
VAAGAGGGAVRGGGHRGRVRRSCSRHRHVIRTCRCFAVLCT